MVWKPPLRNLEFDTAAFEDLAWWVERNRGRAIRVIRLLREMQRNPYFGLGKREPLKQDSIIGLPLPRLTTHFNGSSGWSGISRG